MSQHCHFDLFNMRTQRHVVAMYTPRHKDIMEPQRIMSLCFHVMVTYQQYPMKISPNLLACMSLGDPLSMHLMSPSVS